MGILLSSILLLIVIAVIIFLSISFWVAIFGGGPFVPTPLPAVKKVLKAAAPKKNQTLYDIGAGDGRFVHYAAKQYGANATGFEIDPFVFFLAKIRQKIWGWKGKMIFGNFQKHSLKDADIIVCYMLPKTLARFQSKFERELKKGTKIVSYAFSIGDLKPKKVIPKSGKISKILIYEI